MRRERSPDGPIMAVAAHADPTTQYEEVNLLDCGPGNRKGAIAMADHRNGYKRTVEGDIHTDAGSLRLWPRQAALRPKIVNGNEADTEGLEHLTAPLDIRLRQVLEKIGTYVQIAGAIIGRRTFAEIHKVFIDQCSKQSCSDRLSAGGKPHCNLSE